MAISLGPRRRVRGQAEQTERRAPRRVDSAAVRRRRVLASWLLVGLGTLALIGAMWSNHVTESEAVEITASGTTEVPEVRFFQNPWVLFAQVPDPRHPPSLKEFGCTVDGGELPEQPTDLSIFGSRVVDGVSITPIVDLGRPNGLALTCAAPATTYTPIWAMPSTTAPPFMPTALLIVGIVIMIGAALVHPATADLGQRRRSAG